MAQGQRESDAFSMGPFVWWAGVVEDRNDPEKLGRVRVRIYGYHSPDTGKIQTSNLFWAIPLQSISSAAVSGIGYSPTGIVESSTVVGFFMDGHAAQTPVIIGTLAGKPDVENQISGGGFVDPNGKYPIYDKNESDVNRIARGEQVDKTIIKKKKDGIERSIKTAFDSEWTEKETEADPEYPYCHVYNSERDACIREVDDTEGKERLAEWHRSGTFFEIHPDGTKVTKIVKDRYEITAGDEYVLVKGNVNIRIDGNVSMYVAGNVDQEIAGNRHTKIHGNDTTEIIGSASNELTGNSTEKIGGNLEQTIGGNLSLTTSGMESHNAAKIMLN